MGCSGPREEAYGSAFPATDGDTNRSGAPTEMRARFAHMPGCYDRANCVNPALDESLPSLEQQRCPPE
ncbi:hypothetical protein CNMCM5878_003317 [Aspergillus fumigatiaffinis]|nr:hypothetical protein CNMCM5878_003317 [Aspergillus fumigatiaffinis]